MDDSNESCIDILLSGKELSDDDFEGFTDLLLSRTVCDLRKITSNACVHFTGSLRKNYIVNRLVGMAKIGATHRQDNDKAKSEHLLH